MLNSLFYKPLNPNFGGETFNYQMLLSYSNAQNQFDNNDNALRDFNINSLDNFTGLLTVNY